MTSTINHWVIKSQGVGQTAEDLWNAACRYFMWCELSPVYKPMLSNGEIVQMPIPRPFTLAGLCVHCGITAEYLQDVSRNRDANDFYFVAQRIVQVIYTQKLENGMAGVYNANIVRSELKLGDNNSATKLPAIIKITTIENSAPPMLTNEQDAEM